MFRGCVYSTCVGFGRIYSEGDDDDDDDNDDDDDDDDDIASSIWY